MCLDRKTNSSAVSWTAFHRRLGVSPFQSRKTSFFKKEKKKKEKRILVLSEFFLANCTAQVFFHLLWELLVQEACPSFEPWYHLWGKSGKSFSGAFSNTFPFEEAMETSCVQKLHLTESSLVLALSSHDSQCSKWNEGAPRCWLGCGPARGSLDVPEQIVQESESLLKHVNSCTESKHV